MNRPNFRRLDSGMIEVCVPGAFGMPDQRWVTSDSALEQSLAQAPVRPFEYHHKPVPDECLCAVEDANTNPTTFRVTPSPVSAPWLTRRDVAEMYAGIPAGAPA